MTDELESRWQATNAALAVLTRQGVPEDDPRVQALLGTLDEIEFLVGVRQRAELVVRGSLTSC